MRRHSLARILTNTHAQKNNSNIRKRKQKSANKTKVIREKATRKTNNQMSYLAQSF